MTLALISKATNRVLSRVKEGGWAQYNNRNLVSPAISGWEDDNYKLLTINMFVVPDGYVTVDTPDYQINSMSVDEIYKTTPIITENRWRVPTNLIIKRIETAGKLTEIITFLDARPGIKMRFLTIGSIWNDDSNMLQLLNHLQLNSTIILAPAPSLNTGTL